jgi:hypothetical protein
VRVRLRVQPGDFGDIEFDTFNGMLSVLDGMTKSLNNTDWIASQMDEPQLSEALASIETLKGLFRPHSEPREESYLMTELHVTPVPKSEPLPA